MIAAPFGYHGRTVTAPHRDAPMTRRKLPTGIQTFRKLREDDCYYVDKTAFIAGAGRRAAERAVSPHQVTCPCSRKVYVRQSKQNAAATANENAE